MMVLMVMINLLLAMMMMADRGVLRAKMIFTTLKVSTNSTGEFSNWPVRYRIALHALLHKITFKKLIVDLHLGHKHVKVS